MRPLCEVLWKGFQAEIDVYQEQMIADAMRVSRRSVRVRWDTRSGRRTCSLLGRFGGAS